MADLTVKTMDVGSPTEDGYYTSNKWVQKLLSIQEFLLEFKGRTNFAPRKYQRLYRTNKKKALKILKSMLEGEMSNPMHFRKLQKYLDNCFECLDGLQRSTILIDFVEGRTMAPPINFWHNGEEVKTKKYMSLEELRNTSGMTGKYFTEFLEKVRCLPVVIHSENMSDDEAISTFHSLNDGTPLKREELRDGFNCYLSHWVRAVSTWGDEQGENWQKLKIFDFDITDETVFKNREEKFKLKTKRTETGSSKEKAIHGFKADRTKNQQGLLADFIAFETMHQNNDNPFNELCNDDLKDRIFSESFQYVRPNGMDNRENAIRNGSRITKEVRRRCDILFKMLDTDSSIRRAHNIKEALLRLLYQMTYLIDGQSSEFKEFRRVEGIDSDFYIRDYEKFMKKLLFAHTTEIEEGKKFTKANRTGYAALFPLQSPHEIYEKIFELLRLMELKEKPHECGVVFLDKRETFNRDDKVNRYEKVNGKCEYCDKKIAFADARGDHVIPRSQGIQDGGITTPKNLKISCEPCNRKKGDRIVDLLFDQKINLIVTKEDFFKVPEEQKPAIMN